MFKFYVFCCLYLPIYSLDVLSLNTCKVSIKRQVWGKTYDPISQKNVTVNLYTLDNCKSTRIQIISYGASIASILTPDITGKLEDIVLGFDNIEGEYSFNTSSVFFVGPLNVSKFVWFYAPGYQNPQNAFLGATLGRVANRIGQGTFNISSKQYNLTKNDGNNTIHGGPFSFGKVRLATLQSIKNNDTNFHYNLCDHRFSGMIARIMSRLLWLCVTKVQMVKEDFLEQFEPASNIRWMLKMNCGFSLKLEPAKIHP